MIVEDTTEDMVDVKISIMKICPYTLKENLYSKKNQFQKITSISIRMTNKCIFP